MKLGVALVMVLSCAIGGSLGCSKQEASSRPPAGKERGDCRADKTCDPGLLCLSNLCVRPPPADCQPIAEQLASFDLGNYADPEERAPIVAKYKAACDKAYVTKEQGECFDKATNKWAAQACAPAMFPELKSSGKGDCDKVVAKIRGQMARQMTGATDPQTQQMMTRMLAAMLESCEQDGWPDALKKCTLEANDSADAMGACNLHISPELQQKLAERMSQAMSP